jgi:hypothetical protein
MGARGRKANYDVDAIAEYFIKRTSPDMRLREFAELTSSLACTGHRHVSRDILSEFSKDGQWMRKRAQYFVDQNPDIYKTTIQIHKILTKKLLEDWEDMRGGEIASLTKQQQELSKRVMQYTQPDLETESPFIDPDRAKQIARDVIGVRSADELLAIAGDSIAEETPS